MKKYIYDCQTVERRRVYDTVNNWGQDGWRWLNPETAGDPAERSGSRIEVRLWFECVVELPDEPVITVAEAIEKARGGPAPAPITAYA